VTFNKINTFEWYKQRVYQIEPEHDAEDRIAAFRRALEWGERIPIGIIYKNRRPVLEERIPAIKEEPLINQAFDISVLEPSLKEFY
jgi:2-oxoglutarate ferredoxin oxidoreductase subunit beta